MIETGTVVRLLADKGFGFIRVPEGVEYFFHRSASLDFDSLVIGTPVAFLPTTSPKGLRAERVVRT
jgi:cold shock CspA family protein